jgi:hypothetical protein
MILKKYVVTWMRLVAATAGLLLGSFVADVARSAVDFYQTGASGGGAQVIYAPTTPVSGTMTASVPRFNGTLGTLLQADFEFAGSATGTWLAVGNTGGTSTLSLSGPTDVDGQPMGNLPVGFTGTYTDTTSPNDFNANSTFLTLTSGAFFNSLTGPGSVTMSWIYSGNTTLSTPAVGTSPGSEGFSWGGSVHVTYTYVPEPGSYILCGIGLLSLFAFERKRSLRARWCRT